LLQHRQTAGTGVATKTGKEKLALLLLTAVDFLNK
jgi:hypothetical protein